MAEKASRRAGGGRGPKQRPLLEDVRALVKLMVANELRALDVEDGERKVSLRRGPEPGAAPAAPVAPPAGGAAAEPAAEAPPAAQEALAEIRSPMVGTFYAAPSPDVEAYAPVGAQVGEDSVVCIVEAMKVMNEIKAECGGTIAEVCAQDAQPVEYGQVLFRVRPG
jgi:acetyl-CoA carboxylase biotin carboxyl carrier protein